MDHTRPDPDALLAQVKAEEALARRGLLRIFFGYAAGVGKTYAMLQAARAAKTRGVEVVVGYVEPHARPETQSLVEGIESLPAREIEYRGVVLREFDVDRALTRKPAVLLVDELAHTNAPGCRHEKRWQDVEELLEAGIDVWTTLNVQHMESLNDVIGQITNVVVRETIPDHVFEAADELELVDIAPEGLLARLEEGKIYVPEQARRAIDRFFQRGNLVALRELAMRQAARRIHADVEGARRRQSAQTPWATNEKLLVCVGPSPTTARVIRTAKRMAAAFDAPWIAVAAETVDSIDEATRHRIALHFQLAERLGAETAIAAGPRVSDAILEYARTHNVAKILIGETHQPRWKRALFGSVVDEVLDRSGPIDVYVIHSEDDAPPKEPLQRGRKKRAEWRGYAAAVVSVVGAGCVDGALRWVDFADSEANAAMLFLAAVAWVAYRFGRGPAVLASVLSVIGFDYFFVPPYLTLAVADAQFVVTFGVMLAIGLAISALTSSLRAQLESTRRRERYTTTLSEIGRQLSAINGRTFLASAAGAQLANLLQAEVAVFMHRAGDGPEIVFSHGTSITRHHLSSPVAQWVIDHDQHAGAGTNTLPDAAALFVPITGTRCTHGAIALRPKLEGVDDVASGFERLLAPDARRLIEACASQLALALERDQLTLDAADARIEAEAEQVRSSLLSSVSHDLRTPLAAIACASGSLLDATNLSESTRRDLLLTVRDESERLRRMLENLLQMSRLEAGAAPPNQQWHVVEELVGSALHRLRTELQGRPVTTRLPGDLPLIYVDGMLLEQVIVNLLENAVRHTTDGAAIELEASRETSDASEYAGVPVLRITVRDEGPGVPAGAEQRIFEKFFRAAPTNDSGRGSGLGLAICRAIVAAHGGTITASNRPTGGAQFDVRIPCGESPPQIVVK
ncbi:MAG: sensor histidine kinase KdpD [Pirellulales bacterium]